MLVGVPRESFPGERRVALVPATIPHLTKAGLEVVVEAGAGISAGYPDADYTAKGAKIVSDRADLFRAADIVVQILCYGSNDRTGKADVPLFRSGQVLIGFLRPLGSIETIQEIAAKGVTSFSVELMPRTTRAQSMDVLSSMATICGYKAVVLAADTSPRIFPMLTTAAGTITPGRVFVIGAGVAGLQAIATARRLGAVASAYDLRPAAKEQVQSLSGRFVELPLEAKDAEDARGYARAQDEAFYKRQRELLGKVVVESDVVISAAVIPGKKPPILVTKEMVASMAPGSVIVDLAGERGGNCLLTSLYVFMLAAFIGFEVIRRVSPLLHTPLMSLTNALDAIAVVGAIILAGEHHAHGAMLAKVLGTIAIVAATSNIVGGFLITDRMLRMFKASGPKKP